MARGPVRARLLSVGRPLGGVWATGSGAGPDDPSLWGDGPDGLQEPPGPAVDIHMKRNDDILTGTAIAAPASRALRRARKAAVVSEPRLQIGFDRRSGEYSLAFL